jgi:hypothetical protein
LHEEEEKMSVLIVPDNVYGQVLGSWNRFHNHPYFLPYSWEVEKVLLECRELVYRSYNARYEDAQIVEIPEYQAASYSASIDIYQTLKYLQCIRYQIEIEEDSRLEWCRKVDGKVHGTTGEIPLLALKREPLLPLPAPLVRAKYRWETRKVTRDGFVSFDGARYGVPWQYSGREVRVRICGDQFEVYDGEVRIAHHQIEPTSGRIVWLKGQYEGLAERHGIASPLSYARQTDSASVEIRSLRIYDQVAVVV